MGFAGTFHPQLSGRENLHFLARVYGLDPATMVRSVADFTEMAAEMDAPLAHYASGMMAKFAFGASLAIDFDVYLDQMSA
jgi:capsular polysaccharide transport system ATP-binding protein